MPGDTIDFEWSGNETPASLVDDLQELEDAVDKYLENAMEQAVLLVEADAKAKAPVDTGRLRSSINSTVVREDSELRGVIGSSVSYAPYQEFGTRYMEPNPYLRPAIDENLSEIISLYKKALEKAVAEVA